MPARLSRKRRAQPEPDTSSEEPSPEPATQRRRTSAAGPEEDDASDHAAGPDTSTNNEAVKKMIRLALACEYQRRPIRRAEVGEKVLGAAQSRQFKKVFEEAQDQLQNIFGMEMVELPAREKVTVREKRAQRGEKAKPAAGWVLRSLLPTEFHDPLILPPSAAPTGVEEGRYTAIYSVLISLVALAGGSLPEAKLERYLRRLGMEDATPVAGCAKTEQLLKRLEREGYLLKVKETATAGEEDVSWHVGPRGKVEVGKMGITGLASAVYGDLDEEGEAELQRRLMRSLGDFGEEKKGAVEAGEEKKKRGRKRKDQEAEGEDEDEDDDEE